VDIGSLRYSEIKEQLTNQTKVTALQKLDSSSNQYKSIAQLAPQQDLLGVYTNNEKQNRFISLDMVNEKDSQA